MIISAVVVLPVKMSLDFPDDIPLTTENLQDYFKKQALDYWGLGVAVDTDYRVFECSRKDCEETIVKL